MKRSRGRIYFFVTTNTEKRQQILRDPGVAHFFLNTLRYYKPLLGFKIYSFTSARAYLKGENDYLTDVHPICG